MWLIPDKPLTKELRDVLEIAAQLDLTEFEVFRNAFQYWFGTWPNDKEIEMFFVDYMFQQRVPHWVTHYVRHVQQETAKGVQWRPVSGPTAPQRRPWWPLFVLIVCLTAVSFIAIRQADLFGIVTECYFLPCF
jgi:hypothetical protein